MTDIAKQFQKLVDATYIRRMGCLVECLPNGFILWGKHFSTLEQLDKYIEDGCNRLAESLNQPVNRLKNGGDSSSNQEF